MGGTGSGRFGDGGTCDNHGRLDVRFLHRRMNALRAATLTGTFLPGVLSWHCGGSPRGRAGFACEADPADPSRAGAIGLAFRWRPAGEERWRDCAARVAVEWTPCRYGGERPWWRCPGCGSRRAVLYLVYGIARAGFLCRACAGLSYQSQREDAEGRTLLRAFAIRERLGQKEGGVCVPFPRKPRGMHWRTYDRLRLQGRTVEGRHWKLLGDKLDARGPQRRGVAEVPREVRRVTRVRRMTPAGCPVAGSWPKSEHTKTRGRAAWGLT